MKPADIYEELKRVGLVPIVRTRSADDARVAARGLRAGGLRVVEITLTVPGALDVIEDLASEGGWLLGVGSVLDVESVHAAVRAGARFVISPGFDRAVVEACHEQGVAVLPGALTPTEVLTAWNAGAGMVKVFPCSAVGGAKYLRALKAPLPHVELVPTGGVTLATLEDYLAAGASALGVGTELVDAELAARGDVDAIRQRAEDFLAALATARR